MPWSTKFGRDAFGAPDLSLPFVRNVAPAPLSKLPQISVPPVIFEVVSFVGIASCIVETRQANTEIVFDGIGFVFPYFSGSTYSEAEETNPDGTHVHVCRFSVRRRGGWLSRNITFTVRAKNTSGVEG